MPRDAQRDARAGFATLWRLAHPAHSRAKALLSRAAEAFETLDREYVLETTTAPAPAPTGSRLGSTSSTRPKRRPGRAPARRGRAVPPPTPPARRKAKRGGQMAAIGFDEEEPQSMSLEARTRRFFEAVDARAH